MDQLVTVAPAVTLVTALAQTLDLPDAEYRAIYDRVAVAARSLRNIELALRSRVTFGWWAKYANGDRELDRERKNELRRWASANGGPDLPDLPPTPVEAVAAAVHPDAAVYRIGADLASRVVLVGADVPAIGLRLNGSCAVESAPATLPENASEPACNERYGGDDTRRVHPHRVRYIRPCLSRNPADRIPQLETLLAAARRELEAAA